MAFRHHLVGEAALFPDLTGLVHISGVSDPSVATSDIRDSHRVLVDSADRLDNLAQIAALWTAGYAGPLSFEPFAAEVQQLADLEAALRTSTGFIEAALQVAA